MRKILLLLTILYSCCGILNAQSFVFVHDNVDLEDNATITVREIDEFMFTMDAHASVKKLADSNISTKLTISVEAGAIGGMVGFCGWGTTQCQIVSSGGSLSRTITLTSADLVDPHVEIMAAEPPVDIKVKYTLEGNDETRVLNVHFTTQGAGLNSIDDSDFYISGRDKHMQFNYRFQTNEERILTVYSISGNRMAELDLNPDETSIALPQVAPGVYIYSVRENNKTIRSGKYIVR